MTGRPVTFCGRSVSHEQTRTPPAGILSRRAWGLYEKAWKAASQFIARWAALLVLALTVSACVSPTGPADAIPGMSGTVRDATTNAPLSNATVRAQGAPPSAR